MFDSLMPVAINNSFALLQEQHSLVCFFKDGGFRAATLMAELIAHGRELYDGDIQSLPLPLDAPAEIPRIVLKDQSGTNEIAVSVDRIVVTLKKNTANSEGDLQSLVERTCESAAIFHKLNSGRVHRLALNRIRTLDAPDGAMRLARFFVVPDKINRDTQPPGPLSRCETFEIHAHKKYALIDGLPINSWVRCKSATRLPDKRPIVFVEQDMNTLGEESATRNFGSDEIRNTLTAMNSDADKIYSLYFPQGLPQ